MSPASLTSTPFLLREIRRALLGSQGTVGEVVGVVRQTVAKWEQGKSVPPPSTWAALARAVHPRDVALAARVAAAGDHSLESLGLAAPAPPAPALSLTPAHLADSIVCAAADAMDVTPRSVRPAVVAAFERAMALSMTPEAVLKVLAAPGTKKAR
jgi:DNA-binding XRE family transcriptional regulator